MSGAVENREKEMANHFLRVEIGDTDSFFVGGSEMTESQKVLLNATELVHVGCIDELFTRDLVFLSSQ